MAQNIFFNLGQYAESEQLENLRKMQKDFHDKLNNFFKSLIKTRLDMFKKANLHDLLVELGKSVKNYSLSKSKIQDLNSFSYLAVNLFDDSSNFFNKNENQDKKKFIRFAFKVY